MLNWTTGGESGVIEAGRYDVIFDEDNSGWVLYLDGATIFEGTLTDCLSAAERHAEQNMGVEFHVD